MKVLLDYRDKRSEETSLGTIEISEIMYDADDNTLNIYPLTPCGKYIQIHDVGEKTGNSIIANMFSIHLDMDLTQYLDWEWMDLKE